MNEDPTKLVNEAEEVLAECERVLEEVSESIRAIPDEREEVLKDLDSAKEPERRAWEALERVLEEDLGEWHEAAAEEELAKARGRVRAMRSYLNSDHFDIEYRKAVARQVAGLVREDSRRRLDGIAARSADPDVRRTVAECKEGVFRTTRYVIKMFAEVRDLQLDEVRKARAEAREVLYDLKNPPVG